MEEHIRECLRELHNLNPDSLKTSLYLKRDVLFYAWLLAHQSGSRKIDVHRWVELCATTTKGGMEAAVDHWIARDFFRDDATLSWRRDQYELQREAETAIYTVFNEAEFAYQIDKKIEGLDMKGLQLIEYINKISTKDLNSSKHLALFFKRYFPHVGILPVEKQFSQDSELSITQISHDTWSFWVAVFPHERTLTLNLLITVTFPLIQALARQKTQNVLFIYPSVDDSEGANQIFNENPFLYGMTDLGIVRLMNLIEQANDKKEIQRDLNYMFDPRVRTSFDYSRNHALKRLKGQADNA